MKLTTTNRQEIDEVPWGMWVWQLPDGTFLADDDENVMHVFGTRELGRVASQKLADAARFYGFPEGSAVFWSGRRPITDEEYQEQLMRERLGLVPDPLDLGAIRDEERAKKNHGG